MMLFWGIVATMALVALAFVLPPLLRRGRDSGSLRDQLNLNIYNERLGELERDVSAGNLSRAEFDEARQELQRELLADTAGGGESRPEPRRSVAAAVAIGLALPALALGIYLQVGRHDLAVGVPAASQQASAKDAQGQTHSLEEMVSRLAMRLQEQPDDARGWMMLGRSYVVMGRYAEAALAYGRAKELLGDQPDVLVNLAESLALANQDKLSGRPAALLEQALQIQPNHLKGLWLAGMASFQQGDYGKAVERLEQVAQAVPEDSEDGRAVREQLAEARAQLPGGAPAAVASAPAATTSTAAKSIQVEVQLSPDLANRVEPTDTVFVFARSAQGPRMPLAVFRSPAKDLPAKITLDDSMSMGPAFKLSSADQVVVGVRVSRSGSANGQQGDLEGFSAPVRPGVPDPVVVTVDHVIGEPAKASSEEPGAVPTQAAAAPQGAAGSEEASAEASASAAPAPAAPAGEPSGASTPAKGASVPVHVRLDPSLAGRVAPTDAVFIFARAVQGPPMPLAVARRQVKDLPMTVTLDDSMGIMPTLRLSRFKEVVVGARVSRSGSAMPRSGDLQGFASGVRVGAAQPVDVNIADTVP